MKIRIGIAALLAATTALLGVGCTPPSSDWQAEQQSHNFWNAIGFLFVMGLCQDPNTCPIPGLPVPSPPVDPVVPG
jgi:hypothetical protein